MSDGSDRAGPQSQLLGLLGGTVSPNHIAAPDWPAIAALAQAHRLEPLLAWRGDREGWRLPDAVAAAWTAARRDAAFRALTQQAGLRLALHRLEAAGIAAVALKGVALAWRHYPEAALRPMRDIDLLIARNDGRAAIAVLAEAGFVPDAGGERVIAAALADDHQFPPQHHPELGLTIELHHRLTDPPHRHGYAVPDLSASDVMARAEIVDCGGVAVACPCPQDMAAHLVVHACYGHRLDCGPLVLADLHFLGGAVDWRRLRRIAADGGWLRGVDLILALVQRHFGPLDCEIEQPPDAVLNAAELTLLADPALRGHAEAVADFTAARSPGALVRAVRRRLTPDPDVVVREGGGWPAWAFWPVWAMRRAARLGRRLADPRATADARSASQVMRWVQGA